MAQTPKNAASHPSLLIICPTCGVNSGVPCFKVTIGFDKWRDPQKYVRPPHQGRLDEYEKFKKKVGRPVRKVE